MRREREIELHQKKSYRPITLLWVIMGMFFVGVAESKAQVEVTSSPDVILSQHWALPTLLNPAATGNTDFIRIRGAGRIDYLGSDASPKNFIAAADAPFKVLGKKIGTGLFVNSQSYDLYRNLQVSAQGSYKLQLKKSTLSIGVQIGYYHTKFKGSEMKFTNTGGNQGTGGENKPGDEEGGEEAGEGGGAEDYPEDSPFDTDFPTQDVGAGTIDIGVGLRFEHPKFYVGISGLHLTNPKLRLKKEGESSEGTQYIYSKMPMTLYFEGGGNIAIKNSLFTLQPSLVVASDFTDIQGLAEMRATYNQKVTFGVDYRYNRAVGVIAGLMIKNFYIGYGWEYDYKYSPRGSTGNHELTLGYQLKLDKGGKNTFSHRSIRIM